jgi:hypothetical protein
MFIRALGAVLCAVAIFVASAFASGASAAGERVPGIDIVLKTNPHGIVIADSTTDAKGEFTIKYLVAGRYTIVLGSRNPDAAKAMGGTWSVELLPVSREPAPAAAPQTYAAKAAAAGQQVEIVIPDGPAKTYKITVTR